MQKHQNKGKIKILGPEFLGNKQNFNLFVPRVLEKWVSSENL